VHLHRGKNTADSLAEDDCYAHSYGKDASTDHVDVVRLEVSGIRPDPPIEPEPALHVTTKRLKLQFEERLAARARRPRK
jgi:hypothetical protein